MPGQSPSTLVIGGGVVGLMSAWALAKRNVSISLVDASDWAMESSWAGGGIVCPVPPWKYGVWVDEQVRHSRDLFQQWLPEIQSLSGIDCEYRTTGLLLSGDPAFFPFIEDSGHWRDQCSERHVVGQRKDFEPRLPNGDWPALWLPDVGQVRNPRLTQALVSALRQLGVVMQARCGIDRLSQSTHGSIEAWSGEQKIWTGERVVLAAGAWTDSILKASGIAPLGIYPVRGQMVLYRLLPNEAPSNIINTGQGYLIPRADGHVLAGSTAEEVGFDRRPTQQAFEQITAMAHRTWPQLQEANLICQWSGLRPGFGAERPVVGPIDKQWPGLWVNAGHFRNGLGLAPACAEITAEALG